MSKNEKIEKIHYEIKETKMEYAGQSITVYGLIARNSETQMVFRSLTTHKEKLEEFVLLIQDKDLTLTCLQEYIYDFLCKIYEVV